MNGHSRISPPASRAAAWPRPTLLPHLNARTVWLAAALAIALLALAARLVPGPRTIDDAFITYRYARNILAGDGFVYNPGERVLGTTTPLYTLLMVVLGAFTGGTRAPFPEIALRLNSMADVAACLLLLLLGKRLGSPWAGFAAALVWAIAPFSVTFAIGGLETSLYVLLLTATACAHVHKRRTLTALSGALALLTRPDAVILLGPLALDRLVQAWRKKRADQQAARGNGSRIAELLAFLVPVSVWVAFATAYFGSPIPHSITAKSLAYHLPGEAAFVRLLQHYATPFLGHQTFGVAWIGVGLVIYPFLSAIGARKALRAEPHAWPILAYPWLYFALFALANPLIFRWYLTPPLPFYILGILIGLAQIVQSTLSSSRFSSNSVISVSEPFARTPRHRPALAAWLLPAVFVVLSPVLLSLRGWELRPGHGPASPAPQMAWVELEILYRQAAASLASRLAPDPGSFLLAAGDVGVLGFDTQARILDTVGLNSPQATRYYPLDPAIYTINYAVPPALIRDLRPDFIVILEVYGRAGLLKDPQFWQEYRLVEKIPTTIYGSDGMLVFESSRLSAKDGTGIK